MGLSWASPKNSKSRSTNSGGGGRGDQSYAKQKREAAARKATPKAKISYGNNNSNQRANLPSEVNRPAVRTTPLPSNNVQKVEARPSGSLKTGLTPKVAPKIKTTMGTVTNGYGVNTAIAGSDKGMDSREKAYEAPAVPTLKPAPTQIVKPTLPNTPPPGTPAPKPVVPKAVAPVAESAPINISKDNKTVAEVPKYDQKYWADQLASGVSQADMKTEQNALGMKKAYSGDKVVTADMKRRASDDLSRLTGSMATIQNGGVVKTEGEKYGLLGEKQDTTYDYKGGPSVVTKANDPNILGINLGDKTSTTYVDGTEVATKTGRDPLGKDATVTKPEGLAKDIDDTQAVDPVKAAEQITDIDNQIKAEKDPVKLKALYQRRLRLLRMSRTNTKFAGRLGDADTKRSALTSIM